MYFLYNTHIIHILKCDSKFKILNFKKNMRKNYKIQQIKLKNKKIEIKNKELLEIIYK